MGRNSKGKGDRLPTIKFQVRKCEFQGGYPLKKAKSSRYVFVQNPSPGDSSRDLLIPDRWNFTQSFKKGSLKPPQASQKGASRRIARDTYTVLYTLNPNDPCFEWSLGLVFGQPLRDFGPTSWQFGKFGEAWPLPRLPPEGRCPAGRSQFAVCSLGSRISAQCTGWGGCNGCNGEMPASTGHTKKSVVFAGKVWESGGWFGQEILWVFWGGKP